MYARHQGVCDYQSYQPRVPHINETDLVPLLRELPPPPEDQVRLVYLISAFKDFDHLRELVRAITLPQHLIVIHLERETEPAFVDRIQQELLEEFDNVLVWKFGTIIYTADLISHVFLMMMMTIEDAAATAQWDYDYLINMSSNSYPLLNATATARRLYDEERRVRIGLMWGYGRSTCRNHLKSILVVVSRNGQKKRISLPSHKDVVPREMQPAKWNMCNQKSTSGLTAAYTRDSVQALFASASALDTLQRMKYSGGLSAVELNWVTSLKAIGLEKEVGQPGLTWQGWSCKGMVPKGMARIQNFPLRRNHTCLTVFDRSAGARPHLRVEGDDGLEQALRAALERGTLFARKFDSSDTYWREWIQANMHR
jgi:hypothetical protein